MRAACALGAALILGAVIPAGAAESLDALLERTALDYGRRLETAMQELTSTREKIADEKAPLAGRIRQLEEQILTLESDILRLETAATRSVDRAESMEQDLESVSRNVSYIATLSEENLKGLRDALLPGEFASFGERIAELLDGMTRASSADTNRALDGTELALEHLTRAIGGYTAAGTSLVAKENRVTEGTFAFLGPDAFFAAADGSIHGTVRSREGAPFPVVYPVPGWTRAQADLLFRGEPATLLIDGSGGKALQLLDERGSMIDHIRRGGIVGYIIIGLGALSLLISVMKFIELRQLDADSPESVGALIRSVEGGRIEEASRSCGALRRSCRELFEAGLRHCAKPKDLLEEHLSAVSLRLRMLHERRLPMLAVIVTAAPLLGLLGTVTGMVKTFTLITIYGTGNAAKLSSGISEALVTTELGLTVAVPTLLLQSFLVHRMRKNLALLDNYALQFVTAVDESKAKLQN